MPERQQYKVLWAEAGQLEEFLNKLAPEFAPIHIQHVALPGQAMVLIVCIEHDDEASREVLDLQHELAQSRKSSGRVISDLQARIDRFEGNKPEIVVPETPAERSEADGEDAGAAGPGATG